jgi:acyl carrier protein
MDNVDARLTRCFSAVFPGIAAEQMPNVTMESLNDWDSMATVTLINVVEEEFGLQIAVEEIEDLSSFRSFAAYLQDQK